MNYVNHAYLSTNVDDILDKLEELKDDGPALRRFIDKTRIATQALQSVRPAWSTACIS